MFGRQGNRFGNGFGFVVIRRFFLTGNELNPCFMANDFFGDGFQDVGVFFTDVIAKEIGHRIEDEQIFFFRIRVGNDVAFKPIGENFFGQDLFQIG